MNELIRINKEGKVTARELYEFLLLNSSNFAKWMKVNIIDNQFACEGTDYKVFVPQYENSKGGRPGQDAELSIEFAKKLCMISPSERGEQARNYFIEVEGLYKQGQSDLSALSPELQVLINMELKSKEQDRQINELRQISNVTKQEIKGIWNCQVWFSRKAQGKRKYYHYVDIAMQLR